MINIDFLTIKAFVAENIDFLLNSRIQKIQQPTRKDFILFIHNYSQNKKLYINISPQIYHIAFMSKENEEKRNIEIPQNPPMFCMLLRKHLEGAKIIDIKNIENERIIEFHIEAYDELARTKFLCLCIELMGKHSNVILYDRETNVIIGCAHNIGPEKSRYRELKGGLKYIYPPTKFSMPDELKRQFCNLNENQINYYLKTDNYNPAILDDKYTLFKELLPSSIPQTSINAMIDNYYSRYQQIDNIKILKSKLNEIAKTKLTRINHSIEKINQILSKRDNAEKYKLFGELITANIYQKQYEYQDKINLFDYINNCEIEIELDKTKSLKENAQRFYKLYNKFKTTKEKSLKMLNDLKIKQDYFENVLYSIAISETLSELEDLKLELGLVEKKKNVKLKQVNVEKIIINNFPVYIGKNNKQNDYIVSKLAKDEDIWFHTKNCAGSHVLLKVNELEPNEKTIFECCKIARKYSSAKEPSKVGVIYTKAKYLKKPPASPLGYVTYKNEKEILI